MVGARAPGTERNAFLTRTRRKMILPCGVGGGTRAREVGSRGFGSGGVGGTPRDGANFATCVVFLRFLTRTKRRKMGTHRSWPGEQGGKPRALVAGEGGGA